MKAQELRNKWFDFFKSKQHNIIPSASLVPNNDPTVLFTMAGMFPLVPFLRGEKHPAGSRLANIQKCIRTIDIDEVGDNTHLTFFEMMGNWSLGDYFKREAITWSFEFLTDPQWLGIPINRLAVSVFAGDENAPRDTESAEVWAVCGIPGQRIAYLPAEDNWWIAGTTGPCGPDTEIFYWTDSGTPAPENFQETKDDPRWVEIWNNVFMQFDRQADGTLQPLQSQNVDTGMGLDRVLAVLNGQRSVYDTELFKSLFNVIGVQHEILSNTEQRAARIIVDHVRASVFIAADGIQPSNKERGYILRRLLRRSLVQSRLLNLQGHWFQALVGKVITEYAGAYPELLTESERITNELLDEQKKFEKTIHAGLKEFEKRFVTAEAVSGADAFDLYQTYGFPLELTTELAREAGQTVDANAFATEFSKHQALSRTANAGEFKGGLADHSEMSIKYHTATHLLHHALRQVLGETVLQRGSNITPQRLRFDFSFDRKLTPEEVNQVAELVNNWIAANGVVTREHMELERARQLGAIGLFGEKYSDIVSVYTITQPNGEVISREFCGGPHVERTGTIGTFKIVKEESVGAGLRRIKAIVT